MSEPVEVRTVPAEVARPLRMAILRPHEPPDRAMHAREHDPATLHVAALVAGGDVLSVASVMPEPHPADPQPGDWRLRGMATRADVRGTGLGARVLACSEEHVLASGGERVWCHARTPARGFYERAGYAVEGEEFEVERIGPHFLMSKRL